MNLYAVIKKADYRIIFIVIAVSAVIIGAVTERILFRLSAMSLEVLISDYDNIFSNISSDKSELIRYVFVNYIKSTIILLVLQFTVLGFPYTVYQCFLMLYQYVFVFFALNRCHFGSNIIFLITALTLCLLFSMPIILCMMKCSLQSFVYCNENHVKIFHRTKYQLQTDIKIGIIILIYRALGSVVEAVVCTDLFARLF